MKPLTPFLRACFSFRIHFQSCFEHGIDNYTESLKENVMLFKERYGV